jgi:Protein of unknown function (DUF1761)
MIHFAVNWIAVILAMVVSMALGMAWYMGLAKQWMAALGKTEEEIKASASAMPFVWSAVCQLVMAYFIAMLTPQLMGATSAYSAVLVGVHMWVGFILTAMIINHRYQGNKWSLTLIDGGYLLGVVIVQGIVIGVFG